MAILVTGCGDSPPSDVQPVVVIDQKPDAITNQTDTVFAFHDVEAGTVGFWCTVDGDRVGCESPYEATLSDGEHHFIVASPIGDSQESYDWTIDTKPPDTMITAGPSAVDNVPAESFTFTTIDDHPMSFECALDGISFAPCTSPFAITPGDGDHAFSVRAVDAASNVDPTPAEYAWTLDSVPPVTQITAGPDEGTTTAPHVTFEFTASKPSTFICDINSGSLIEACTSPYTPALPQPGNDHYTFTVRATDAHGFVEPSPPTRSWNVDWFAPILSLSSFPFPETDDETGTFIFSSFDDPLARFECTTTFPNSWAPCTSPFTVGFGVDSFDVRAIDILGNVSPSQGRSWLITPFAETFQVNLFDATSTQAVFHWNSVSFAVRFECRVDNDPFAPCAGGELTGGEFTTGPLENGTHTVEVHCFDVAGNFGRGSVAFDMPFTGLRAQRSAP